MPFAPDEPGQVQANPLPAERRVLTDTPFLTSDEGRELLKYLIECALPEHVTLVAQVETKEVLFSGGMGLAPSWLDRTPTERESRWVSACILARTNYFRKKVRISMQSHTSGAPEFLKPTPTEALATLYEGDFFGNLFATRPVAYTCLGRRSTLEAQNDILKARICTEVDPSRAGGPYPMTWCGFYLTGACDSPQAHTAEGVSYDEVISIYLKPLPPR